MGGPILFCFSEGGGVLLLEFLRYYNKYYILEFVSAFYPLVRVMEIGYNSTATQSVYITFGIQHLLFVILFNIYLA